MTIDSTNKIPTREQCLELMEKTSMLPNIVEHSLQVMRVALAIADNLQSDLSIDRDMVMAGALLHDITKTRSLLTREHHDASGGAFLRELGFPAVAEIVEQHVRLRDWNPEGRLSEKEIVYYADKRVMHDKIVTVEERLRDLLARYGRNEDTRAQIMRNSEQVLAVERKMSGLMKADVDLAADLA